MYRYESDIYTLSDKTKVKVTVVLDDKGHWIINDVMYKEYKKRSFISKESELSRRYQYSSLPLMDRCIKIKDDLIEYIGKELYEEVLYKAWISIMPDSHCIVE